MRIVTANHESICIRDAQAFSPPSKLMDPLHQTGDAPAPSAASRGVLAGIFRVVRICGSDVTMLHSYLKISNHAC